MTDLQSNTIPQDSEAAPVEAPEVAINEDFSEGSIQISNSVIASIVQKYTLGVEGVVRFLPQGIVEGIADILSKRNYDRSIEIEFDNDEVEISVTLILLFGCTVVDVAKQVQKVIKEKVEAMTGVKVRKVNVYIRDLEEKPVEPEPADEEEEAAAAEEKSADLAE